MPDKEDWLHDSFIRKELLDTDFMEKHGILHYFNTKPAHYYCSLLDAISRGFRYNQEMGFAPDPRIRCLSSQRPDARRALIGSIGTVGAELQAFGIDDALFPGFHTGKAKWKDHRRRAHWT